MSSTPVEVTRTGTRTFEATNPRGARALVGPETAEGVFTPGELLLAAVAACVGVTSDSLVVRRVGEDAGFQVRADRTKESEDAHEFASVTVDLDVDTSALDDEQRAALATAVDRAVEKLCTVSRTLKKGVPVTLNQQR
ncbi:MAG TPA: OsmC family protein [Streptosporangiaceae bacterium]|jgi:uncharacterized OsmC-like protein